MKIKRTKHSIVIDCLLVAVLIAGVLLFAAKIKNRQQAAGSKPTNDEVAQNTKTNSINYEGPTDADKQETSSHKVDLLKNTQSNSKDTTPPSQNLQNVTPTLINAFYSTERNQVTVSGFVSGVIEDGGSCTVTLTHENTSVTKTAIGVANASQTDCPPFNINRSELSSSGTWSVMLSYKSDTVNGNSRTQTVEVP